jgi:hypothetical protein
MDDGKPAAVLTLGRLRVSRTIRFLRASAAAEGQAVGEPALLASTGLARAVWAGIEPTHRRVLPALLRHFARASSPTHARAASASRS